MTAVLLSGGVVVNGAEGGPASERRADVLVDNGVIVAVGSDLATDNVRVIDCTSRLVIPGLVDGHSHGDGTVFDSDVALALLRQGVTTIVVGQDGVSFAPGSGAYGRSYFGPLNGDNVNYRGGGVGELLGTYDGTTPVNVGYLIPAGTVRAEVVGDSPRAASDDEVRAMTELVRQGMAEGALGLSTGLDYVPGLFADTAELSAICRPVAETNGVHVSHMRGGYEDNAPAGINELIAIHRASGVRTHVSHFHGPPPVVLELADDWARESLPFTFDAYPYRRGCTLLAMLLLEPDLLALGTAHVVAELRDPAARGRIVAETLDRAAHRPDLGSGWPATVTIAHATHPDWAWIVGMTIADAAANREVDATALAFELLAECGLQVTAVVANPRQRSIDELSSILAHPAHLAGSDGIYVGGHPHPRGWGTFARMMGLHTRERGDYDWPTAVDHLSARAARVYGLGKRGRVEAGFVADLAVVDPTTVADTASYDDPRSLAVGVDDVLVGGRLVLSGGALTGEQSGVGIRRAPHVG